MEVWGPQHEGAIVRELTKMHEQVMRDSLQNILTEVTVSRSAKIAYKTAYTHHIDLRITHVESIP
jgi:16S rRNA C1402 (ribose-2'-O) methylase RsmI